MSQKKTSIIEAKYETSQAFSKVKKNLNGMETFVNKTKKSFDGLKAGIAGVVAGCDRI